MLLANNQAVEAVSAECPPLTTETFFAQPTLQLDQSRQLEEDQHATHVKPILFTAIHKRRG